MTMIERVAREIAKAGLGEDVWESLTQSERDWRLFLARAAIDAMKPPTVAMIEAGSDAHEDCTDWSIGSNSDGDRYEYMTINIDAPEHVYTAMIDAALKE